MTQLPNLPAGIYRHHKGHLYQAIGYANDDTDAIVVVYLGLELAGAKSATPRLHTRIAASSDPHIDAWWDFVHDDGTKCTHPRSAEQPATCVTGPLTPRFAYLGPTYNSDS